MNTLQSSYKVYAAIDSLIASADDTRKISAAVAKAEQPNQNGMDELNALIALMTTLDGVLTNAQVQKSKDQNVPGGSVINWDNNDRQYFNEEANQADGTTVVDVPVDPTSPAYQKELSMVQSMLSSGFDYYDAQSGWVGSTLADHTDGMKRYLKKQFSDASDAEINITITKMNSSMQANYAQHFASWDVFGDVDAQSYTDGNGNKISADAFNKMSGAVAGYNLQLMYINMWYT